MREKGKIFIEIFARDDEEDQKLIGSGNEREEGTPEYPENEPDRRISK